MDKKIPLIWYDKETGHICFGSGDTLFLKVSVEDAAGAKNHDPQALYQSNTLNSVSAVYVDILSQDILKTMQMLSEIGADVFLQTRDGAIQTLGAYMKTLLDKVAVGEEAAEDMGLVLSLIFAVLVRYADTYGQHLETDQDIPTA